MRWNIICNEFIENRFKDQENHKIGRILSFSKMCRFVKINHYKYFVYFYKVFCENNFIYGEKKLL